MSTDASAAADYQLIHEPDSNSHWMTAYLPPHQLGELLGDERITPAHAREFFDYSRVMAVSAFVRRRWAAHGVQADFVALLSGKVALSQSLLVGDEWGDLSDEDLADAVRHLTETARLIELDMAARPGQVSLFGKELLDYLDTRVQAPSRGAGSEVRSAQSGDEEVNVLLEAVLVHSAGGPATGGSGGARDLLGHGGEADRAVVEHEVEMFALAHPAAGSALRAWVADQPTARQQLEEIVAGAGGSPDAGCLAEIR
ncbi:hypothetical protein AA0Y32_07905 [Georgenia phoenicis]|uniref:hypothetical protein n=1 Tax=unclassified Georgenia TaxID=2626815 RepID=UPI0039AF3391